MLIEETSYFYSVWWVLTSFSREIREEEKCTLTSRRKVLWPTHLTSRWLTHCGFLTLQMWIHAVIMCEEQGNIVCISLPQSLQNLKHNIQRAIGNNLKLAPLSVTQHFRKEKACLKSGNWQPKAVL
jgi:hypothetical protein